MPDLNELIGGGVKARQLTVLAAPTGAGKTGFVGTEADAWTEQGIPVLFVCTEIDEQEQVARAAAIALRRQGLHAQPDDILALRIAPERAAEALQGRPLYILNLDDPDGDPFLIIADRVRAIIAATGHAPIVILDYLQVLAVQDAEQVRMSVTKVATRLRRLARVLDVAVVAISSVSRAFYGANRKRPAADGDEENPLDWLAAAKESGDIEYACAVFAYLDTDGEVDQLGESAARLVVAKSRRGRRGFAGARFHGPSGAFVPAADALTKMAGEARTDRDDAKVLAFLRAPGYAPKVKRELRAAVRGLRATAVDAALDRLLARGLVEAREETKAGSTRPSKLYVAVGAVAVDAAQGERLPYAD